MTDLDRLAAQLGASLGRRAAYLDLADAVRGLVLDGQLVVGDNLPPQRALADALGLSRTTVVAALTVLRAEGFLSSRQGSATTVTLPTEQTERPDESGVGGSPRNPPIDIDLSIAVLPAPRAVASAAVRAADRLAEHLAGSGLHPFGLAALRRAIAERLCLRGLPTTPDQVLITQGALHGWDLVLRAYARPAGGVVVEQPGYPAAIDAVRAHRARPQPLAVTSDGWQWPARTGATGRASTLASADIAYLVADFQNPTGYLAGASQRRALLRRLRGPLVCVDETFAELGDPDEPDVAPVGSFGRDVVTIGSLSKLVWAGLRIGWLRAPSDTVTRIAAARSSQDIAAPVLDQLLALELLDDLDAIRADRRAMLHTRRRRAVEIVRSAGWHVDEPRGGMFLWVDLRGESSTRLSAAARERGVRVPPGPRYSTSRTHDRFLRLPFTGPTDRLAEAVRRMTGAGVDGDVGEPTEAIWTV